MDTYPQSNIGFNWKTHLDMLSTLKSGEDFFYQSFIFLSYVAL